MTSSSCVLCSTVCRLKTGKVTCLISETLVAGTKLDERKLRGSWLARRLRGIPGAFARRRVKVVELSEDEGYKIIFTFLEATRYKSDAVHKKLLANRRYESASRKAGQSLQDFFKLSTWLDLTPSNLEVRSMTIDVPVTY